MKYSSAVLLFLFITYNIFAQTITFERNYNFSPYLNSAATEVIQLEDSGYVFTGLLYNSNNETSFFNIIRTDNEGNPIWTKNYFGADADLFYKYSILETYNGNFLIGACSNKFGTGNNIDGYVLSLNSNGDSLWGKTYGETGEEKIFSMVNSQDSGFLFTGYTENIGNGSWDVFLVKTLSNGDTIYTKSIGGSAADWALNISETHDNNYIVIGGTYSYGKGNSDIYLIKFDPAGDTIFTKTYGGVGWELGHVVRETKDNGFIICGTSSDTGTLSGAQIYILKTDSLGVEKWELKIQDAFDDLVYSITETEDGSFVLSGTITTDTYNKISLIKISISGQIIWNKEFNSPDVNYVSYHVISTLDGGFALTGYSEKLSSGEVNSLLIKTDSNGNITFIIEEIKEEQQLFNFPNPFKTSTIIQLKKPIMNGMVEIYNKQGQTVDALSYLNGNVITLKKGNLSSGLYFYRVTSMGEFIGVGKLIIE